MTTNNHSGAEGAGSLRPVAAHAIGLSELHSVGEGEGGEPAVPENPLHAIKARLRICVGTLDMSVGELLAAKVNEVFTLDRTLQQPVDLVLEGQTVARGQLVAVDGHFAVRITELPVPLRA